MYLSQLVYVLGKYWGANPLATILFFDTEKVALPLSRVRDTVDDLVFELVLAHLLLIDGLEVAR